MNPLNPIVVVIGRSDVERGDVSFTMEALAAFFQSPEAARTYRERVDFAFHGYDDDPRELFEIDEVRKFVRRLDEQFPYWIYFMTRHGGGLQCILLCFMPPFLTPEGKAKHFPERLRDIADKRWLPAAGKMCGYAGQTEEELESLFRSFMQYAAADPMKN